MAYRAPANARKGGKGYSDAPVLLEDGRPADALCLATLVTNPRFGLYLTTDQQIADLGSSLVDDFHRPMRGTFVDWHLITLQDYRTSRTSAHLVGKRQASSRITVTSRVSLVDLANNKIITRNSDYLLGLRAEGEPSLPYLLTIILVFQKWGIAGTLGMPNVQLWDDQ